MHRRFNSILIGINTLLLCALLLSGCERKTPHYQNKFFTLGTEVNVDINTDNKKNLNRFIKDFEEKSTQQTKDLYAWGNGELVSINQSLDQAQCTLPLSADMLSLSVRSKSLSEQSKGFFDPGVMPIVELWGFHRSEAMRSEPPSDKEIQDTRNQFGLIQNVDIRAKTLCSDKPVKLDLGAIAKGWAGHTSLQQLKQHNIQNALINFGGDLVLIGKNSQNKNWRIGLRSPDYKNSPAVFEFTGTQPVAVFTSGDYERSFEHEGKKSHHILDPRTGYPNTDLRSVTVVHSDPVVADAAATALHVAGKNWRALANHMNLDKVLVIYPKKRAQITTELQKDTQWLDDSYEIEVVERVN